MGKAEESRSLAAKFYGRVLKGRGGAALVESLQETSLSAEIGLMRVLIKRAVEDGADLETVARACGRVAQMLRIQRQLTGLAAESLEAALAGILDEVAGQVGL